MSTDCFFLASELPIELQGLHANEVKGCSVLFSLQPSKEGKRQAWGLRLGNLGGASRLTAEQARELGYDVAASTAKGGNAKSGAAAANWSMGGWEAQAWNADGWAAQTWTEQPGKGKGKGNEGNWGGKGTAGSGGWNGGDWGSGGSGWEAGPGAAWTGWDDGSSTAWTGSPDGWGATGNGQSTGGGYEEGARLTGELASLDLLSSQQGLISCPGMPCEVPFSVGELPACLQPRSPESLQAVLHVGKKLFFTLAYDPSTWKPKARELMLCPGPEDIFFGHVRSYSSNSGYGFIAPNEDSTYTRDVYFQAGDLPRSNGEDLGRLRLEGTSVSFRIEFTKDQKARAKSLEIMTRPAGILSEDVAEPTGKVLTGTIKSFKASSGYGFITCPSLGRDVWYARRELPADAGLQGLPGTEVVFELWNTKDGMAQARCVGALDGSWGTGGTAKRAAGVAAEPDAKRARP